jgi:hypothetical protein
MRSTWKSRLIIAGNLSVITLVLGASATVPTGRFVAVVMPPWAGSGAGIAAVAEAGGAPVAQGRVDWIVIARAEEAGFAARVRHAGAWLVLNHQVFSGCFSGSGVVGDI